VLRIKEHLIRDAKYGKELEEEFGRIDKDKSGAVDSYELQTCLDKVGIALTKAESKMVIHKFSSNKVTMKYKDFLKAFENSSSSLKSIDAIVSKMRDSLRDYVSGGSQSNRTIKAAFTEMDSIGSGFLGARQFERALLSLKVDVSRDDMASIAEAFDTDRRGIDYRAFLFKLLESKPSQTMLVDTDAILVRIRRALHDYLGPGAGSARKIKEVFADMDRDKSGTIDKREFEKAMAVLRVELRRDDTDLLYERFDTGRRGGLDYKEFLSLLNFSGDSIVNKDLLADTDEVVRMIRRGLLDYLGPGASSARRVKDTFAEMDRDSSGTIDKVEFEKAMSVLKIDLRKEDINKLFLRFDRDRQGLDYREFLELLDFRDSNSKDEKDNSPPGSRYRGSGR